MDAEFFKKRQKALGVTSDDLGKAIGRDRTVISRIYAGIRTMRPEEVSIFARLLEISVDEVLEHAGLNSPSVVRAMARPGFGEEEAAPFDWENSAHNLIAIRGVTGFGRPGIDVWTVKGKGMNLAGYLDGDTIVVDQNLSERPVDGDDVVAQVYDFLSGSAKTVFRRYSKPFLFAISTEQADLKPFLVDDQQVVIKGIVTFLWRQKTRSKE